MEMTHSTVIEWDFDKDGPIPVYSDYEFLVKSLTYEKYKIVEDPKQAKIQWLSTDYEQKKFYDWGDLSNTYKSWFEKEGALVSKNHLAGLVNSTLCEPEKSCIQ